MWVTRPKEVFILSGPRGNRNYILLDDMAKKRGQIDFDILFGQNLPKISGNPHYCFLPKIRMM